MVIAEANSSRVQERSPTGESTSEYPMVCGRVACCFAHAARWCQKSRVSSVHLRSTAVSPSVADPGGASANVEWMLRTFARNLPPRTVVILPPQSPPWATNSAMLPGQPSVRIRGAACAR
ncbi:hypothetical protein [Actinomadura nitritigenes]|uniref:hypothetical protein n=1 Tax=Actinomadura nitritigenes TaxID=134602 RepID=UPI003D94636C